MNKKRTIAALLAPVFLWATLSPALANTNHEIAAIASDQPLSATSETPLASIAKYLEIEEQQLENVALILSGAIIIGFVGYSRSHGPRSQDK